MASLESPHEAATQTLEIVIPVYNEEKILANSIRRLLAYLQDHPLPVYWWIRIVDNASTDNTQHVGEELASLLSHSVRYQRLDRKGRGWALRRAWLDSSAGIVSYMDVDLSTDLKYLAQLIEPILTKQAHLSVGSRLSPESKVRRSLRREIISRGYNLILRLLLNANFSDAQCGFKAMSGSLAKTLIPLVEDNEWFFDTELLIVAQRFGVPIAQVPVKWIEDPDSRVEIVSTAWKDLKGIARLMKRGRPAPPPEQ